MTLDQWAVICTIKQEPAYRFIGTERRMALEMVEAGWLKALGGDTYRLTKAGLKAYDGQRFVAHLPTREE